jgi:hypothetical protein
VKKDDAMTTTKTPSASRRSRTPLQSGKRRNPRQGKGRAALAASNSLVDLAARIRVEHNAASLNLSEALRHAMAAGDLRPRRRLR